MAEEVELEELAGWLERLGAPLQHIDWQPFLHACGGLLEEFTRANFESGHAPDGTPWAPVKQAQAGAGSGQPLSAGGALMASVTGQAEGHIEDYQDQVLTFGTALQYAATHQYGDPDRHASEAQYLAIPLTSDARHAGNARDFPRKLFVIPSKIPDSGLLAETDEGGNLVFQYVLKKSVSIPARPFLGLENEELLSRIDAAAAELVLTQLANA